MKIKNLKVGLLKTNCYILIKGDKCLIIDPGACEKEIIKMLDNLVVSGIIITHHHFDHVGALKKVQKYTGARVYDITNLREGQNIIGDFSFSVIYTPGHKEDSICLYFEDEKKLFSGDFIFKGMIGRWDLKGGDIEMMKESIRKILVYPNDIKIYPGHGDATFLGDEKENLERYINS